MNGLNDGLGFFPVFLESIPGFALGRVTVLNGLPGTFVETAQALIAGCAPNRAALPQGDGSGRAAVGAQAAAITGGICMERLGTAGKPIEPKVYQTGLQPGSAAFFDPENRFALQNLPG